MENSRDLPLEIVTDILIRLPSKDLLRFSCVSKSWNALISSPEFAKSHLNHSIDTSKSNTFLVRVDDASIFTTAFPAQGETTHTVTTVPLSLRSIGEGKEVFGSSHGLVCISDSFNMMVLYNPSIRSIKEVPACSDVPVRKRSADESGNWVNYGFGYDSHEDDYKIVRIDAGRNRSIPQVRVYSLRSNSWKRKASDFKYRLSYARSPGKLVGNCVHWVSFDMSLDHSSAIDYNMVDYTRNVIRKGLIVAFDLHTESFGLVPVPDGVSFCPAMSVFNMSVLGSKLVVIDTYYRLNGKGACNLWIMKEYGVKESWTKLCTLPYEELLPKSTDTPVLNLITYSKEEKEILIEQRNRYYLYELESGKARSAQIRGFPRGILFNDDPFCIGAEICIDSLVSFSHYASKDVAGSKTKQVRKDDSVSKKKGPKDRRRGKKNDDDFLALGFKLKL